MTSTGFNPVLSVMKQNAAEEMPTSDIPLSEIMERMKAPPDTDALHGLVKLARDAKAWGDEKGYRRAKAALPGYMVAGRFPVEGYMWKQSLDSNGKPRMRRDGKTPMRVRVKAGEGEKSDGRGARGENHMLEHAGLMAFDYDKFGDVGEMDAAIARLIAHDSTAYVVRSVGGDGFHAAIRVEAPDVEIADIRLNKNHKILWRATAAKIRELCGLPKEKDDSTSQSANRLHFVTIDPALFYNPDCVPLELPAWDKLVEKDVPSQDRAERTGQSQTSRKPRNAARRPDEIRDSVDYNTRLDWLRKNSDYLPVYDGADDANKFEGVLFTIGHLGEYDLADSYCARHKGSRAADSGRVERAPAPAGFDANRSLNFLLKLMRENGWKDPREEARAKKAALDDAVIGRVGYDHCHDFNAIEWILQANSTSLVAAFEYFPPPAAEGKAAGSFYQRRSNGLLGRHGLNLGSIGALAHRAYLREAKQKLEDRELGVVTTHASKLMRINGGAKFAEGIANAIGALEARGAASPAPVYDLAAIDKDGRYLGVKNGCIDLHTGELITDAYERGILVSRAVPTAYNPDAKSVWVDRLINHPTSPESAGFMLDSAARALHRKARTDKRIIVMFDVNKGNSGKSAWWDAIAGALGSEYAQPLKKDALEASKGGGRANPEVKPITEGALAYMSEFQDIQANADAIKMVSGEKMIIYRDLYGTFIARYITATLFASANGSPRLPLWDSAIMQRYCPVEFIQIPEEARDDRMVEVWDEDSEEGRVAREALLAELIRRAVKYKDAPPPLPKGVMAVKRAHRESALGNLGMFVEDCLVRGGETDKVSTLSVWQAWADWNEEDASSDRIDGETKGGVSRRIGKTFGVSTRTVDIGGKKTRGWRGLRLRADVESDATSDFWDDAMEGSWEECQGCGRKTKESGMCALCKNG